MLYAKNCFIVEDVEGVSLRESKNLKFDTDGFKNVKFKVILDGENSSVETRTKSRIKYIQVNNNTIFGIDKNKFNGIVIETYTFYLNENKMIFTKIINGYGSTYNGTKVFVGKIKSKCY